MSVATNVGEPASGKDKKLSYRRGTARRAMSVAILSTAIYCTKITFEKVCNK